MSRKTSERRRAQLIVRREADLRTELERVAAVVADCSWCGPDCPCHWAEWRDLEAIKLLLGDDTP